MSAIRPDHEDPEFPVRQSRLLDLILASPPPPFDPELQERAGNGGDETAVRAHMFAYHHRLRYFYACGVRGHDMAGVNDYYAGSPDFDAKRWNGPRNEPDWKIGPIMRAMHEFGPRLSAPARDRMAGLMRNYRSSIGFGGTENHIVNRVVLTLLIDQYLGIDDRRTASARTNFRRWVWKRGHRGYMEFNSPTYHEHCVVPLLHLFDFTGDPELRALAQKALDQVMAEIAIESIDGSRGGPWHRAVRPYELNDSRTDVAYIASHLFFGNTPEPDHLVAAANFATTRYRIPEVIFHMGANRAGRGRYAVRHRVDTVRPRLNAYFYITPLYSLACFQNRPPFRCHYYGSTNCANLQPWELSFGDPTKVLGVRRNLTVVTDYDNPSTVLMQFENVLFFAGRWLDYSGNLGAPEHERDGESERYFFRVATRAGEVYAAIIEHADSGTGVLEVGVPVDFAGWEDFKSKIRATECAFAQDAVHYTDTAGRAIAYARGRATVDGREFALRDYPLCDSPFVRSEWDSGIVELSFQGCHLRLDFSDPTVQSGDGLRAEYFEGCGFRGKAIRRIDQTIDYNWGKERPDPGIGTDAFSVRWEGNFLSDFSGEHVFTFRADGTIRVLVDGVTVLERLAPVAAAVEISGTVALAKPGMHRIQIEYSHHSGEAACIAHWSSPHSPRSTLGLLSDLFPETDEPA